MQTSFPHPYLSYKNQLLEKESTNTENEAFINARRDFEQEGAKQVSAVNDLFMFWA